MSRGWIAKSNAGPQYKCKLNVGCFLGIRPVDILCYADDIVLCAPSQSGLQILINKTCDILNLHCLPLNDKSEYIVFACRRFHNFSYSVLIDGCIFNNIDETKYLGAILSSDFKLDHDINRSCFSFLKQYNAVFHRFSFLDKNILSFLIHSHCMSFYGVETWFDYRNKNIFRGIGVAYHKAVKRLAGMAPWESNHKACELMHFPIFIHFINFKLVTYLFSILHSNSFCLNSLRYYFRYDSFILANVENIFKDQYGVSNILENDLEALLARINFTERNEERTFYAI